MINTFILEGVIKEISELKETDNGIHYTKVLIEGKRNYKNREGQYDVDLIEIELWRGLAEDCIENAKKDDCIAIQGRVQSHQLTSNEGKSFITYKFIAEKVVYFK